ncbi:hypothetical protein [Streptomyces sp. NPDC006739]|uniref:hypothetical protein n=1 Tax=Streptomyces sp. NPDC006739 TaxID=3364763 RepID=UPI00367556BD
MKGSSHGTTFPLLELRRRAVRMVAEVRGDYPNETAALQAVTEKLGIGSRETLRNWVKQHEPINHSGRLSSSPAPDARCRSREQR